MSILLMTTEQLLTEQLVLANKLVALRFSSELVVNDTYDSLRAVIRELAFRNVIAQDAYNFYTAIN